MKKNINSDKNVIPLSLYIHIPWCVQKCPYCDFNSHQLKIPIDYQAYIRHLILDLEHDLKWVTDRQLHSIFIGGGTPSLFPADAINQLLFEIQQRIPFNHDIEITLESNPNSADVNHFKGYTDAGINRISIGVQSFSSDKLILLGRVHNEVEAQSAITLAQQSNLNSFNIDLMHGLPNQIVEEGLNDLKQAISYSPPHLSWYQLTIEPNTLFSSKPPKLPDDDSLWELYEQGNDLLKKSGYQQYETSAYSKPGYQCNHNLNYWQFGDYLGIGCGAHGKITLEDNSIIRTAKIKHPSGYLRGDYLDTQYFVAENDRPFEFFMNQFRLFEPTPKKRFEERTFLPLSVIEKNIEQSLKQNYITETKTHWELTQKGKLFLNSLLMNFMNDEE